MGTKKEEFVDGVLGKMSKAPDVDQSECGIYTAGINLERHLHWSHQIQFHARTEAEAVSMRDTAFEALLEKPKERTMATQPINDHVTLPNYPCQEVKEFGERISEAMFEASIRQSMARLGGCKEFRIEDFDEEMRPYILAYLEGNFNSTSIIYAAMRTKELELT